MDIVDRFRNKIMNDIMIKLRTKDYVLSAEEFIEAADEIERLRKRVELLEGYLKKALWLDERWTIADVKDARQALGEKE